MKIEGEISGDGGRETEKDSQLRGRLIQKCGRYHNIGWRLGSI
jgi:hypothetical protein